MNSKIKLSTLLESSFSDTTTYPYDTKHDLEVSLGYALPGNAKYETKISKWIKSIVPTQFKEYPGYTVILKDETKIQCIKNTPKQGNWIYVIKNKVIKNNKHLAQYFLSRHLTPFDKYKKYVDERDWYADYSSDSLTSNFLAKKNKRMQQLFGNLNDIEKRQAFSYYNSKAPDSKQRTDFDSFTGI